jgi:hypothetical protein
LDDGGIAVKHHQEDGQGIENDLFDSVQFFIHGNTCRL